MGVDAVILVKSHERPTDTELVDLSWEIVEAVGPEFFWLGEGRMAIQRRHSGTDEADLDISTLSRYYGPGYERGHWPSIGAVLAWLLHRNIGQVFYNGDCSEPCPMDFKKLNDLWLHWAIHGRQPYCRSGASFHGWKGPKCCGREVYNYGGGGGWEFGSCPVCRRRYEFNDKECKEMKGVS